MEQASPAIRLVDLRKLYGAKAAVDGLTLEVPRGSFFGFLGPNGAGKTTTIRMMIGLADNITVGYIREGGNLDNLLKFSEKNISCLG